MAKKKEKEIKNAKEVVEEKLKKKKVSAAKNEEKKEKPQKHGTTEGKETSGQAPQEAPKASPKEAPQGSPKEARQAAEQESQVPPIQLTFHTYLIMLGSIGWQFLGKIPNPQTGKIDKNLMRVKEIIDLLEILEEKTKGNLTTEEDHVFKSTLSNLRLNYVDEMKK